MKWTKINKELKESIVQQCLTLRIKGQSHRDIAQTITAYRREGDLAAGLEPDPGFSISYKTVGNWLAERLTVLARENAHNAEHLRQLELSRLDWLLESIAPQVDAGDPASVNAAIRVNESRRKLLGLDAPQKIAPTDPTGEREYESLSDAELNRRILEHLAAQPANDLAPAIAIASTGPQPT